MKHIAQGIASLGRGNDTQLVHMTPNEVGAMQNFAMSQGGSLTTNPHTGLPEAGFLDKMLPTLLGVGASLLMPGVAPWMIGAGIGGLQAARTGDIGAGITAGLGAYGGAGVTGGLASMGENAGLSNWQNAQNAADTAVAQSPNALSGQVAELAPYTNSPVLGSQQLGNAAAGVQELGTEAGRTAFGNTVGFGKVAAAAAPAIADAMQPKPLTNNPMAGSPGDRYSYVYDQKTGTYGPPKITHYSAEGGEIKGMAKGSYVPKSSSVRGGPYEDDSADMLSRDRALQELIASLSGTNPALEAPYTRMAGGGIAALGGEYAAGGKLLQGPGDGMSDSIPAVIKGPRPQRAALAQGEFVIPADVVSHLGNGSTDAGAKQLYAMMDKIRHARTGNKKQGKQINPAKFIPA
jgi:hypothetical protein